MPLTATPERLQPRTSDLPPERLSLTDNSRFSAHLSRYESRVHRMYHRAMDTLLGPILFI